MNKAFKSIAQGLQEAIDLNEGKVVQAKTYKPEPIDVAALRSELGLTQNEFAAKFCISVATLRHWERGDRTPPWTSFSFTKCSRQRTASCFTSTLKLVLVCSTSAVERTQHT